MLAAYAILCQTSESIAVTRKSDANAPGYTLLPRTAWNMDSSVATRSISAASEIHPGDPDVTEPSSAPRAHQLTRERRR